MHPMVTRMLTALGAAGVLGLLDIWISDVNAATLAGFNEPLFWFSFLNRLSIGFFVAIAGVFTLHPLFRVRTYLLRGVFVGLWVSLPMAVLTLQDPLATGFALWFVLLTGAFYGALVDYIATRTAGDGRTLLLPENK